MRIICNSFHFAQSALTAFTFLTHANAILIPNPGKYLPQVRGTLNEPFKLDKHDFWENESRIKVHLSSNDHKSSVATCF